MCLVLQFISCTSNVSVSADKEVPYEKPAIEKNTNMGADLPFINYESEHQLIFSHALDNSKMFRAIKPFDSKIQIGTQGDTAAAVQVDYEKQI